MDTLAGAHPDAGITFMKGIEYLEKPGPEYLALVKGDDGEGCARSLGLRGFRVLGKGELPDERVVLGIEYDTWCVNPMVYCSWLLNRFVYRGGKVVRAVVREPAEVFELGLGRIDVVVNASGQGFGDEKVFITRGPSFLAGACGFVILCVCGGCLGGDTLTCHPKPTGQTCLIANKCDATVTRQNADGSWTFCVPRNFDGGTVIGGTKEPGNWDPTPSPDVREELIRKFVATYPSIIADETGSVTVLRDIVGRRPTRYGGARIEREDVAPGRAVVHAYGLGGRGFEMSWGVAEAVARLVGEAGLAKGRL